MEKLFLVDQAFGSQGNFTPGELPRLRKRVRKNCHRKKSVAEVYRRYHLLLLRGGREKADFPVLRQQSINFLSVIPIEEYDSGGRLSEVVRMFGYISVVWFSTSHGEFKRWSRTSHRH